MLKKILTVGLALCAGSVFAGESAELYTMIEPEMSSDSDATGALILLAIVGVIIATSAVTTRAKAEKDPFLLAENDDES